MDKASELKKRLREVVGLDLILPITGTVVSVDTDHCRVKLKSGLIVSDVKLQATISRGSNFLRLIPKVDSTVVMISLTADLNNLTVVKFDEVEKVEYSQNGLEVLIDSTDRKVSIKNSEASLVEVLEDLTTLLKSFKVYTPAGPSGTALPDSVVLINQLEVKYKKLLK